MKRRVFLAAGVLCTALAAGGCTRESLRVALAAQARADDVQQAVFERQNESLRVLLYRDMLTRLAAEGPPPTDPQRAALEQVWNERDLVEFWTVQHERARALRIAGVDAKLASDQAVVDVLLKSLNAKVARGQEALAQAAAQDAAEEPAGAP